MELTFSCRNDGTDLLSPLSFSGLENNLLGCEGTVETEEEQFKMFQKSLHIKAVQFRNGTWLETTNFR